ncbi:MAG: DUF1385 domain-containing protein [Bacteroidota bacterium]
MSENKSDWVPTNPKYDPEKPMQVGGQAVIEGVMMRSANGIATAVRRANGDIVVQKKEHIAITERSSVLALPIIRGAVGLIDMMYLGIKTLNWSAEIAMMDEEIKTKGSVSVKKGKKGEGAILTALTLAVALILGVGLFFALPLFVASKLFAVEQTAVAFNLVAGGIRMCLLLGYMLAISMLEDVKRLFRYHGAEHKSVFAFELKSELIPVKVKEFSRFHPRCGTSFLLIVVFVAILSFSLIDAFWLTFIGHITLATRLFVHLPFVPVVGGLAYEMIRFSAKHSSSRWGKIIIAPGLWLQKITTKEPDEAQIEVALVALRCALGELDASAFPLKETEPAGTQVTA